jgi:hypothetical protein
VQLLRGVAFTVLLLAGVWVLNFALYWPEGGLSVSGELGWAWHPHWLLLAVLLGIGVAAVVAGHRKRIARLLRPLGIAAIAMVAAVGAVVALEAADQPPSIVQFCQTLPKCQSIMSRAYGGARVLAPSTSTLTFGSGEVLAFRGGDMAVTLVDVSPPASIFFEITDYGTQPCLPKGTRGVTKAGYVYCLFVGRCDALADTTTGGLTYAFSVLGSGPCTPSWEHQERDRLTSILDSLH